jgi:hypothetical protein
MGGFANREPVMGALTGGWRALPTCRWRTAAKDRDISSRSDKVSTRRDRRRSAGLMPPCGRRCAKIDEECLPKTLPISFSPSPRCHRSQISALSAAVNLRLCPIVHLTSSKVKCCNDQLNPRWLADVETPHRKPCVNGAGVKRPHYQTQPQRDQSLPNWHQGDVVHKVANDGQKEP